MLFRDPAIPALNETGDPIAPKAHSAEGKRKCLEKTTQDGHPLHSLATLVAGMGTLQRHTMRVAGQDGPTWSQLGVPSAWHRKVFETAGIPLT